MKRLLPVVACLLAPVLWPARAEDCLAVEGDRLLAADLARAQPLFSALDPGTFIAHSPAPGARRVIGPDQLQRLARTHQLPEVSMGAVCFERPAQILAKEQVFAALRQGVGEGTSEIEIVDYSRYPVPRGELDFQPEGLAAPSLVQPEAPRLWRGRVRYGQGRSVPVWARVRVRVAGRLVIAARDLPAGKPIGPDDLLEETHEAAPRREAPAGSIAEVLGGVPRKAIRTGEPLYPSLLRMPADVSAGELVEVEVSSGAARLRLEAKAETAGRRGDPVYLRNPASGKRFTAVVEGKGMARVHCCAGGREP